MSKVFRNLETDPVGEIHHGQKADVGDRRTFPETIGALLLPYQLGEGGEAFFYRLPRPTLRRLFTRQFAHPREDLQVLHRVDFTGNHHGCCPDPRAADWIGYDRAAIGEAVANTAREYDFGGPLLRRYWLNYGGVTRWRANASYRLRGDLSVLLGGENLLNVQRGAPDNATVTAGRTLSFGLRSMF